MAQFGTVFTPKRWELVEALKTAGPLSIYALAKSLNRHYRNVHKDVTALIEWTVIEKNEAGKVFVPWDEIDVRWPLLRYAA
jgi:predicted transcriptional regulator